MNGTAHAAIGAAGGFMVANSLQAEPATTIFLVGLGGVTALVPDLDINGKLSGKITLSHKIIRLVAQLIGLMLVFYSFYEGGGTTKFIGIGIGLVIVSIASSIKQKHMLTITGAGVFLSGLSLDEMWLILIGIYIMIASIVAHRSYTHSIVGLLFFGVIASYLETSFGIDGVFYTSMIGYMSHLVADSKILPFNKRGIKLFLPISSKEF